ncbi:MAG: NAD(P)/FAD-dependent oxidoreductase [Phycisphaerales bacterium]|nr:NAD(P)/FAD-dependent oxidoreductase [Phycisphaerales bacterium]
MHYDLAILGAGAAGMMAAVFAGEACRHATISPRIAIFEKNTQPGAKVLVCGGGRCNFTNAGPIDFLIRQFGRNGRFLTPALRHMDNKKLQNFFTARGVPSHEETGGKIYPNSNQAKSIVEALLRNIRELGIEIITGMAGAVTAIQRIENTESTENTETTVKIKIKIKTSVLSVSSVPSVFFELVMANGQTHTAKTLLLAVGGMSYPRMGTTGDGYRFARALGHSIVTPRPAIVGLLTQEKWPKSLQGLAVPEVEVMLPPHKKSVRADRMSKGDMLFTHFGLSGPAILNPSEIFAELLESSTTAPLGIDFLPRCSHEELHRMMREWQQKLGKKLLRKMFSEMDGRDFALPQRLAEKWLELEKIPLDQSCASLAAAQMHRLVERIKQSRFTICGTRGFQEAMVTAGGVTLGEVDPHTMQSKITPSLYLVGEVLDLTGPSGGYNLQLAFATGALAGAAMANELVADKHRQK